MEKTRKSNKEFLKSKFDNTKQSVNRIRILTAMQLKDKMKTGIRLSNKRKLVKIIVKSFTFIIITAAFYLLLFLLDKAFGFGKIINYKPDLVITTPLLTFFLLGMQLTSVISCTGGLMETLYLSKDNPILLSFPAKHIEVFVSKLLVFYVSEFIKNLYFVIPFLIAMGLSFTMDINLVVYFCNIIPLIIVLPLIPVLIGSLLSLPLMYFKRFIKGSLIVQVFFTIVCLIATFIGLTLLIRILPDPLNIIANYNKFFNSVLNFFNVINKYSLYCNSISRILIQNNYWSNFFIIVGLILSCSLFIFLVTMPTYFKIASHSGENAIEKVHKGINKKAPTLFNAFLKKEFLLSIRNYGALINNYLLIIAFPFVVFFMSNVYSRMGTDSLGNQLILVFIIFIGLFMLMSSNSASASAITVEGGEFALLKTAPANTSMMAWAKIFVNLLFSSIIILMSFLLLQFAPKEFATGINTSDLWLMFVLFILVNAGHILWSFQLDIRNSELNEYASTGSLAEHKNIKDSITIGFVVAICFALVRFCLFFGDNYGSPFTNMVVWIKLILIAIVFFLSRLYLFRANLDVYFDEIEM